MSLKESNYSEHKCQYSAFCKPNQKATHKPRSGQKETEVGA